MQITVNGSTESHPDGITIVRLLEHHDLAKAPCAVEVNKVLVPRREHAECTLTQGDAVEIVTFVGGG